MKKTLNIKGKTLELSRPIVMGILNATPDSFYNNSRVPTVELFLERANQMLDDGAKILDIGGYSTRPNASDISPQEEADRVLPLIEALAKARPDATISVDTFRANVARQAIMAGGHIVNDVSGGNLDPEMFDTVTTLGVPYVLMHSRGTPQTMSQLNQYDDLVQDVIQELVEKVDVLRRKGINDIIIDLGFGFAKNIDQNFELFKNLEAFKVFELPLLVGISRKSMIWRTLNTTPDKALNATTVLNTIALQKGADIIRVHDVRPAIESIFFFERCR